MADTESTVTLRRDQEGAGPRSGLLVADTPPGPEETRDWFREAIPGTARSPWKSPEKKIGMG